MKKSLLWVLVIVVVVLGCVATFVCTQAFATSQRVLDIGETVTVRGSSQFKIEGGGTLVCGQAPFSIDRIEAKTGKGSLYDPGNAACPYSVKILGTPGWLDSQLDYTLNGSNSNDVVVINDHSDGAVISVQQDPPWLKIVLLIWVKFLMTPILLVVLLLLFLEGSS
jgi:hypothetical protein